MDPNFSKDTHLASLEGREKSIEIYQGPLAKKKSTFDFNLFYIRSRQLKVLSIHMRMKPQLEGQIILPSLTLTWQILSPPLTLIRLRIVH